MLGRLEMDVDDAIKCYRDFAKRVFGKKKWWLSDGKYMAKALEESIREVIAKEVISPNAKLRILEEHCKTYVSAFSSKTQFMLIEINFNAQICLRTQCGPKPSGNDV